MDDRSGTSCFAGGHFANPQHGDAWRKHLPGHALQLLRSKLRVEKIDRFLFEKRRHDLLGRAGKLQVYGGFLTDTGPALMALGARVRLVSRSGEREVLLSDLYNNDGIDYIKRRPDEILVEVVLDSLREWKSTYWKLRRRGSFDFPVLSVAAAARLSKANVVEDARIVVGSAACRPLSATVAANPCLGRPLNQSSIEEAAALAARIAKPLDNTDFDMTWRKRVTAEFVTYALRELRGDDVSAERESFTRYSFE